MLDFSILPITYTGPFNNTGYGHASIGYLLVLDFLKKELKKKNVILDLKFRCIGEPDFSEGSELNDELYRNLYNKYIISNDYSIPIHSKNIVFWHASHAPKYIIPGNLNFLITTFELDKLSSIEIEAMDKFDGLLFASNFNQHIAGCTPELNKKVKYNIVPHISYTMERILLEEDTSNLFNSFKSKKRKEFFARDFSIKELTREVLFNYLDIPTELHKKCSLISNIGKFENRKGHFEYLEAIKNLANRDLSLPLVFLNFWNNPFLPKEYITENILKKGFVPYTTKIKSYCKYTLNNVTLITHSPIVTRKELYSIIALSDIYMDTSKAEGFGLPFFDILTSYNRPLNMLTTINRGSEDYITKYHNYTYSIKELHDCKVLLVTDNLSLYKKEYEQAKDEFFFKNVDGATWLKVYPEDLEKSILRTIPSFRSEDFNSFNLYASVASSITTFLDTLITLSKVINCYKYLDSNVVTVNVGDLILE